MAEDNSTRNLIIAGVIGLAFVGLTQVQKINSSNTANLPATNANVATNQTAITDLRDQSSGDIAELRDQLTKNIADLRDQLTADIAEAEKTSADALNSEAQLIRAEINRREPEVLETVATLNRERSDDIRELRNDIDAMDQRLRSDISEIRRQEFEHVNTPKASHASDNDLN